MSIAYQSHLNGIEAGALEGYFVGWPTRPSAAMLLATLRASHRVELAVTPGGDRVVGFA